MVLHLPANRAACLGALETSRLAILRQSPGMGRQVAYGSQFETRRDRALSAAQAIRCKLGGKDYISIDDDMPPKPKWMRWNTYERITRRCEANEAICNLYLLGFLARLKNQR
jgi:hypothetical protein